MDTTQIEKLSKTAVKLIYKHEDWLELNDVRCKHVSGLYWLFIERYTDTGNISRITWQAPAEVVWKDNNKCPATPGFTEIAEACESLFNFFHEDRCKFTLGYIAKKWNIINIASAGNAAGEPEGFDHRVWILETEGIVGRWFWDHRKNNLWFEDEDDALLFKLSRLGD